MTTADPRQIAAVAARWEAPMIAFAQRAIQTPSMSGEEQALARLLADELRALGYDDVWTDRVGNVIGVYRGSGSGRSVQFNSHIDHVSPGDHALWQRPPFGGVIEGDTLYGRAASDVKGAMAPQVYLVPVLRELGVRPTGDIYVVGVVLEEVGGLGTRTLCEEMPTTFAVLSEATNNQLRRGHRGRVGIRVSFTGLSVHASAPERGHNPHYALARFVQALERLELIKDATFGGSSMAPTLIATDQTSGNVTPGTLTLAVDWRNVPGESEADIVAQLEPLVRAAEIDGVRGELFIPQRPVRAYTGIEDVVPSTGGFVVAADDPLVMTAAAALERQLGGPIEVGTWTFATDGGHLSRFGIKTIGFSPGEERFAHTIHDQISLTKMRAALPGNVALALALPEIRDQTEESA
jgi:succinyl-diaminopimelate desuccinylase